MATSSDNIWTQVNSIPNSIGQMENDSVVLPISYDLYILDTVSLLNLTKNAADIKSTKPIDSQVIVNLPYADGSFIDFRVVKSGVLPPALQAKFPYIRSYAGEAIDMPATTVRFEISPSGFNGMILSPNGTFYIDPLSSKNGRYYLCYDKKDYPSGKNDRFYEPATNKR